MKIQIKNRWDASVLFECEADNLKIAVELAVKSGANLSGANLSEANLSGANLSGANLSRADLDYASWPLWCGTKKVKVCAKIFAQLCAHLSVVDYKMPAALKKELLKVAVKSHRAVDLGLKPQGGTDARPK